METIRGESRAERGRSLPRSGREADYSGSFWKLLNLRYTSLRSPRLPCVQESAGNW